MAGFPDERRSIELLVACAEGGADVLEIGIPFSDPIADGPTIQKASQAALEKGITPDKALELAGLLRSRTSVPIVLMGYYNPIFRMGEAPFALKAMKAGVDGVIVADLPHEESSSLRTECSLNGLDLVQLVGPTTDEERMADIAKDSSGFLYVVGNLGTTGSRANLSAELPDLIARATGAAKGLPVAVGFGVSNREQVREIVACGAEGVIVGSALIEKVQKGATSLDMREVVARLKSGCYRT